MSLDFFKELENSKLKGPENKVVRDYVLPDYTHIKKGYVKVKFKLFLCNCQTVNNGTVVHWTASCWYFYVDVTK